MLGVSVNTVAVHRANIMQTLGIHNTAELVVYAIRNGLVSILDAADVSLGRRQRRRMASRIPAFSSPTSRSRRH